MLVINGAVSARINGASPTSGTDTSDADMTAADLLAPKIGYGSDGKLTGEMPDNADNDVEVSDLDGTAIPAGYYNGSGAAKLSDAEAAKVVAGNIKKDTVILGVTGTYEGAPITPEKFITPTLTIPAPPTVSVSTAVAAI